LTFVMSDVFQAITEMYSTPNGAQGPTEEGEASGGESGDDQREWEPTVKEREATMSTPVKRRRRRLNPPIRRGDPSSHTIQRGSVVVRLPLLGSR